MVAVGEAGFGFADEAIAVQAGDERLVQTAASIYKFAERRHAQREDRKQLSEGLRLHLEDGCACALTGDTEELNLRVCHD